MIGSRLSGALCLLVVFSLAACPDKRSPARSPRLERRTNAETLAQFLQTVKTGPYRALLRFGTRNGVAYRHRADGKITERHRLSHEDLDALAGVRRGDRFRFMHYLISLKEELNSADRGEIAYDKTQPIIKYYGYSGHWGVTFTFTRSREGLVLQTVETWDIEP